MPYTTRKVEYWENGKKKIREILIEIESEENQEPIVPDPNLRYSPLAERIEFIVNRNIYD